MYCCGRALWILWATKRKLSGVPDQVKLELSLAAEITNLTLLYIADGRRDDLMGNNPIMLGKVEVRKAELT